MISVYSDGKICVKLVFMYFNIQIYCTVHLSEKVVIEDSTISRVSVCTKLFRGIVINLYRKAALIRAGAITGTHTTGGLKCN